mgnify:CR=1 FL=1
MLRKEKLRSSRDLRRDLSVTKYADGNGWLVRQSGDHHGHTVDLKEIEKRSMLSSRVSGSLRRWCCAEIVLNLVPRMAGMSYKAIVSSL